MKIVIDARLYGLENAGLGRYLINLIKQLSVIDSNNDYIILLRKKYYQELKFPSKWQKILCNFGHYGFNEQIRLPGLIRSLSPDLVHFPHFNIPIFYKGKYVVTIHDMLMHNQRGFEATTLNPISYLIKRMGYKIIFSTAVRFSSKIIVPSNSVKKDLLNYYHIDSSKVEVIYEG